MATGDLKNNIQKLISNLKSMKCPHELNIDKVTLGDPTAYLSIYHYMLLEYSPKIAEQVLKAGVQLAGRNDRRFMEGVYKIMRDIFAYKPPVTIDKFFGTSFVERKVIMCSDMARLVREKHENLALFRAKKFTQSKYAGVGLRLPTRTFNSLVEVASAAYHNSPELDSTEFHYDAIEQPDVDSGALSDWRKLMVAFLAFSEPSVQQNSDYSPFQEQVSVLQQGVEQLQLGVESLRTTLQDQVDQLQYENELLRSDVKSLTCQVEKYEHNEQTLRCEIQSTNEKLLELEKMKTIVPEKENQGEPEVKNCDKDVDLDEEEQQQDGENHRTGATEFLRSFREPSIRAAANRLFKMMQEHERLVSHNGDEYPTTG